MKIIHSLLDTDWYKITMGNAILRTYPDVWVRWKFKCRNESIVWTSQMVSQIWEEIEHLCTLRMTEKEVDFIKTIKYLPRGYAEFLRMLQLDPSLVRIGLKGDQLEIEVEGPWFLTTWFEIPILAIVNEVYFQKATPREPLFEGMKRLGDKIEYVKKHPFRFTDFGTRRRFSREWQDFVVQKLSTQLPRHIFSGTSNPYLAMKYGLTPTGTVAHEWMMVPQAIEGVTLASSQKYALQKWADVYRADLGIALTDTLGFSKFLKDFDLYFSQLYSGLRHDSGDPITWAQRAILHYRMLGIDPATKQLVFSDGLDFKTAYKLHRLFNGKIMVSFGIGTNLTNDVGFTPLQIVMKIVEVNGKPVAKISDSLGKGMCEDEEFLSYLRKVCGMVPY